MSDTGSIAVGCPTCKATFELAVAASGQTVSCPNCSADMTIPKAPKPKDDLWDLEFWKESSNYAPLKESISTASSNELRYSDVVVTTGDIKQDYQIIGPVYFQLSNKGIFQGDYKKYEQKHETWLYEQRRNSQIRSVTGWSILFGEIAVGQSQFDNAFFIAVQELKLRAFMLGGDAIVAMRHDIDLDTTGVQGFYLQMYGTAVKLVANE